MQLASTFNGDEKSEAYRSGTALAATNKTE